MTPAGSTACVFAVYGCGMNMSESGDAGSSSGALVSTSLEQPSRADCALTRENCLFRLVQVKDGKDTLNVMDGTLFIP